MAFAPDLKRSNSVVSTLVELLGSRGRVTKASLDKNLATFSLKPGDRQIELPKKGVLRVTGMNKPGEEPEFTFRYFPEESILALHLGISFHSASKYLFSHFRGPSQAPLQLPLPEEVGIDLHYNAPAGAWHMLPNELLDHTQDFSFSTGVQTDSFCLKLKEGEGAENTRETAEEPTEQSPLNRQPPYSLYYWTPALCSSKRTKAEEMAFIEALKATGLIDHKTIPKGSRFTKDREILRLTSRPSYEVLRKLEGVVKENAFKGEGVEVRTNLHLKGTIPRKVVVVIPSAMDWFLEFGEITTPLYTIKRSNRPQAHISYTTQLIFHNDQEALETAARAASMLYDPYAAAGKQIAVELVTYPKRGAGIGEQPFTPILPKKE
jgi:hypothetical protein